MEPLFPDAAAGASSAGVASIRPDSFYGKVLNTAAREYLDMRKAANLGPATPREVYEALVKGGYASDAKDEITATTIVRATLRKNSSVFHRLPNGTYGLLSWYPNARPQRDGEDDETPARPKKKGRKPVKRSKPTPKAPATEAVPKATKIRQELKAFLTHGNLHVSRVELDEVWSFVKKKRRSVQENDPETVGEQFIYIAMDSTGKAILSWLVGKRNTRNTINFVADVRHRVLGNPEISTDGYARYIRAVDEAFEGTASHGIVDKQEVIIAKGPDATKYYAKQVLVKVERTAISRLLNK